MASALKAFHADVCRLRFDISLAMKNVPSQKSLRFVQAEPRLMVPEEFYRLVRDHRHAPFGKPTSMGGHDKVFGHARAVLIKVATPYFQIFGCRESSGAGEACEALYPVRAILRRARYFRPDDFFASSSRLLSV